MRLPSRSTERDQSVVKKSGSASATGGGLAVSGNVTVESLALASQKPAPISVTWPYQVGVIPNRAHGFLRRTALDALSAEIGTASKPGPRCYVLSGMGGVGKTQMAAELARSAWAADSVDLMLWIVASSRNTIISGLAQAGVEVLGADPTAPEKAAERFLAWLEPKAGMPACRWLIVLDDVSDPADLAHLWPPDSPSGRTVVTTRRRDASMLGRQRVLVPVHTFTQAEALAYINEVFAGHGRDESEQDLGRLAADLGYLPLALSQAATYIVDTDSTCGSYCRLLRDRTRSLSDLVPNPSQRETLPDDQKLTLAAAWALSVERAQQTRPVGLARPVLELAAVLEPNGIPITVLVCDDAVKYVRERSGAPEATADDVVAALRVLYRLSIIEFDAGVPAQAVRIHQLVQRSSRETLTADERDAAVRAAADALLQALPDTGIDSELVQAIHANSYALLGCAGRALYRPTAHPLLFRLGRSLGQFGQTQAAIAHYSAVLTEMTQLLGPEDVDTLAARQGLAYWRGISGDGAGAAIEFAELVHKMVDAFGPTHPRTLSTRQHHAHWQGVMGDDAAAITSFSLLAQDFATELGPDHPDTLAVELSLAHWRAVAGDPAGAESALRALADRCRAALGPDHPRTLAARGGAAARRGRWPQGDAGTAITELNELLEDQIRLLGEFSVEVLVTRADIAQFVGLAGDPSAAVRDYEGLITDYTRVLGAEHPRTLEVRYQAARFRRDAGDVGRAMHLASAVLADCIATFGQEHPQSLDLRRYMATWPGVLGNPGQAVEELTDLLAVYLRVLGSEHYKTRELRETIDRWTKRRDGAHRTQGPSLPGKGVV